MLNYNTISLEENVQYIYLSIFIMLFIVIILFYLKETNRKHYKLFEKYGETIGGTQIYSKQELKLDPAPLFYPSEGSSVTLRPCEIRFNKNGSSNTFLKMIGKKLPRLIIIRAKIAQIYHMLKKS
jgi:hypothetical protein